MRVLITGAAGFLGSHIVDRCLAQGDQVRVIVRKSSDLSYLHTLKDRIEIFFGDLTDQKAVDDSVENIDVIYHSAGRVTDYGSYEDFYSANCVATHCLLEAARAKAVKRFVFVSSPSIFADAHDHIEFDEKEPYPKHYINYYAKTKALSEQEVLAANSESLVTCSLRPRGVWGPRDKSGFVPKLLFAIAQGKMKNLAPGKRVMGSISYVTNVADACLAAARSPNVGGQAYFIADREPVPTWEFMDEVARVFGLAPVKGEVNPRIIKLVVTLIELIWKVPYLKNNKSPPLSRYALGLLTQHGTYSIKKAQKDFGYDPKITANSGLIELKKWVDAIGGFDAFVKNVK